MSGIAECHQLAQRLTTGWERIAAAEARGEDVAKLEAFWLRLLAQYCARCAVRNGDVALAAREEMSA